MIYDFLIVAGGKGTRSINPDVPKSLQLIDGVPLINHQLFELNRLAKNELVAVTIVTGYKSDLLVNHINSIMDEFSNLTIKVITELKQTGTFNPVYLNSFENSLEYTIVILGDLYFKLNINSFNLNLTSLLNDSTDIGIFLHPNDHPQDSDLVSIDPIDQSVSQVFLKNLIGSESRGNLAISGFFLIRNAILREFNRTEGDLVSLFVLESIHAARKVKGIISIDVINDMGTKDRISKIESSKFKSKSANLTKESKQALFLDLDDTLISNVEVKNMHSSIFIHLELIDLIAECNKLGIPVVLVSNQPGIAKGFFTSKDLENFLRSLETKLAENFVYLDDHIFCPHHPDSGWENEILELKFDCDCRKPKTGMFVTMSIKHSIDLTKSLFVGNSQADKSAADSCGLKYIEFTPGLDIFCHKYVSNFLRRDILAQ
jgi:mannose-1-phosphate guanylyltransferase/phosphomannomutase